MTADHPVRPWVVTDPCTCTKPGRAPDLSPAEAARVAEFDAAPEPPEIVVERVARAMYEAVPDETFGGQVLRWEDFFEGTRDDYRTQARAAIAALDAS